MIFSFILKQLWHGLHYCAISMSYLVFCRLLFLVRLLINVLFVRRVYLFSLSSLCTDCPAFRKFSLVASVLDNPWLLFCLIALMIFFGGKAGFLKKCSIFAFIFTCTRRGCHHFSLFSICEWLHNGVGNVS